MSKINAAMTDPNSVNLFSRVIILWSRGKEVDQVTPAQAQLILKIDLGYLQSTQDLVLYD